MIKPPTAKLTLLALVATTSLSQAVVLVASQNLEIQRDNTVSSGFINVTNGNGISTTDRYAIYRFDSTTDFGATAGSATFTLTPGNGVVGPFSFSVFGVNDGIGADETFSEVGFVPNAGVVFDAAADLGFSLTNVTLLGTASGVTAGTNLSFSDASLSTFIQGDMNGTVTLLVVRNEEGGGTSNFLNRTTVANGTAPTLEVLAIPEPSSLALLGLGMIGFLARRRR